MARQKPDRPYRAEINNQSIPVNIPSDPPIRTVPQEGVCDAFYPYPNQAHGHHLQTADTEIEMSVWGWGEQGRQLWQEDENHDETIKPNSKR